MNWLIPDKWGFNVYLTRPLIEIYLFYLSYSKMYLQFSCFKCDAIGLHNVFLLPFKGIFLYYCCNILFFLLLKPYYIIITFKTYMGWLEAARINF